MSERKKGYLIVIGISLIIVTLISLNVIQANKNNTTEIDGMKVTYDELQRMIEEKENELNDITNELNENKNFYDELQAIAKERNDLLETINEYKDEIMSLENEIEKKQKELDKLSGEIVKVKDDPIKINPGYYYFGIDNIEPGRYRMTAQEGQRGNVFVRDHERGMSYVAETFGDGTNGSVKEFTFYADEGDEIEATIPVYLYPVE